MTFDIGKEVLHTKGYPIVPDILRDARKVIKFKESGSVFQRELPSS